MSSRNEFMLFIKLIRLDPDTGKALVPPCETACQLSFNLNAYTEEWLCATLTVRDARKAVKGILKKINEAFGCPLGWMILMTKFQKDSVEALFTPIESEMSEEFCYDPGRGMTEVEIDFMKEWVLSIQKQEK